MIARLPFSQMDCGIKTPCCCRSSGTSATPACIAPAGSWRTRPVPATITLPESMASRPKIARRTSVRPAPTRPASPTISPAFTLREMSVKRGLRVNPLTSRATSPRLGSPRSTKWCTSRPTIQRRTASTFVSLRSVSPTLRPSRRTLIRSQMLKISSIR